MSVPGGPVAEAWRAGDLVDGRYEVLGELGQGGMGVVHRVRHLGWGVDLAVKSPHRELFQAPGARERFAAEAETWVGLGVHQNVCASHYVRVLGGVPRVFGAGDKKGAASPLRQQSPGSYLSLCRSTRTIVRIVVALRPSEYRDIGV